ncbi:MAG: 30S ribosomal protein S8 [Phycisphaerales bacterium]|nr:30S ribosomal protein S8 [Phycisphaerales bacterium]
MGMTDPISDMLTRIRNAGRNRAKSVNCLNSKVCRGIAAILREEGYIEGFDVLEDGRQGQIRIRLRYGPRGEVILNEIKRESKPGCRRYVKASEITRPLGGMGICIVSTSQGVKSDRSCRAENIGGELLATVF